MLKKLLARDDGATLIQVLIGGAVVLVLVVTAANWGAEKVDQTVQDVTKANNARNKDLDALIAKEFKCKGSATGGGSTGGGTAGGQTVRPMVDYLAFTCPEQNQGAQVTGQVGSNKPSVQRQGRDTTGDPVNPSGGIAADPGRSDPAYSDPSDEETVFTNPGHQDPGPSTGHEDPGSSTGHENPGSSSDEDYSSGHEDD